RQPMDASGRDAGVLDRLDRDLDTVVVDAFTFFDEPAGPVEDEAGDRLELLALRQFNIERLVDVLNVDLTLDEHRVRVDLLDRFALAAFEDLADDLLDHVLDRDQPLGGAELV